MDVRKRCAEIDRVRGRALEADRLADLIDANWQWRLEEYPELSTYVGQPGRNHRWTDMTPGAIERRKGDVRAQVEAARGLDGDALGEDDRLNLELLRAELEVDLEGTRFPDEYLILGPMHGPQADVPGVMRLMPAFSAEQLQDVVARLHALPETIDQSIELLRLGIDSRITMPGVVLDGVAEQIATLGSEESAAGPMLEPFERVARDVPAADVAAQREEALAAIRDRAAPAFRRLHEFVTETYLPAARESVALGDLPDGDAWYQHQVRKYTTARLAPGEIHRIGLEEVARIGDEMDRVMREAGFSSSRDQFNEFLRTDPQFFFQDASALLAAYRDIAKRADPELIRLFGRLPRLPYGILPVPRFLERTAPTAYYQPGSPEGARPGYFYANTFDLKSRPKWEMEALTLHEAVPGHHLQLALAQELSGVPDFRKHAHYTAYIEGWGLYAESLGEEIGFYADPHSRFGRLIYEMWRAIRLVVDTGMHALGWSRQRAIDYFVEHAGKAEHDIVVEINRYIAWPGQALAYKIGELKLKEVRARAREALGEAFDVRAFHDAVLGSGALPLDVLERRIDAWIAARTASATPATA